MSLEQWLQTGSLLRHDPTVAEIRQLFEVADRDIGDASVVGLSADCRFNLGYNAGLQLCVIALHASGFKTAKGQGHHLTTINALDLCMGDSYKNTKVYLSRCNRLRSQGIYDRVGVVQERDAVELLATVKTLRRDVSEWLQKNHADLC